MSDFFTDNTLAEGEKPLLLKKRFYNRYSLTIFFIVICIVLWWATSIAPPSTFPSSTLFKIEEGDTLHDISAHLKESSLIKSVTTFEIFAMLFGSDKHIAQGDYYFEKPASAISLAYQIASENRRIEPIKITLPEGQTRIEMADSIGKKLPNFDREEFLLQTKDAEGYLFPDTYFFFPSVSEAEIVVRLRETFDEKILAFKDDITTSGYTQEEVIIMASILEKEASGASDRAIVAGILWKRLAAQMPLQVDATVKYAQELAGNFGSSINTTFPSPYNTYMHKGLPPGPIGNPGTAALHDALHPQASLYFFYLHDKNGMIHYAKTFDEHKKNTILYL